MLIEQKLQDHKNLSPNEIIVAQFILDQKENLSGLSINTIAKQTHTSLSTTVRLSQKVGFRGWRELKDALKEEQDYLKTNFQEIDSNIPFSQKDSYQDVKYKMAALLSDAIMDTAQLMHHDELVSAIHFLSKAKNIYIFAITNTAAIAYDFQYKMRYLFKKVLVVENPEEFPFVLNMTEPDDCCILISYSGETFELFDVKELKRKHQFTTVSITSLGDNSLKSYCDCNLHISTREKLYSKIGHFVSNESIHYILDVLYACLFKMDYQSNWDNKLEFSKRIDKERFTSVNILEEHTDNDFANKK